MNDLERLTECLERIGVRFFTMSKDEFDDTEWDNFGFHVLCFADSKTWGNKYFCLEFDEEGQYIK